MHPLSQREHLQQETSASGVKPAEGLLKQSSEPYLRFGQFVQSLIRNTGWISHGQNRNRPPSKRKVLEEARNKAEWYDLNFLAENIEEVLFSFDLLENRLLRISPGCERIYGYSAKVFLENPLLWFSVIHEEDGYILRQTAERLASGKITENQYRIIHRDGSVRWIENKIMPVKDTDGSLVRLDGITRDITEKRKTQERLTESEYEVREREKVYKAIFDNNPVPMWLLDPENFRFLNVNNAATRHYGYSAAEFLAKTILNITADADRLRVQDLLKNRPAMPFTFGSRHCCKNGKIISVEVTGDSVILGGKEVWIVSAHDITERLAAEEEVRKMNERYAIVTRATNDMIWDLDLVTEELYWSEAYVNTFGYSVDERRTTLQSWAERVHEDDLQRVKDNLHRVIHGEKSGYWEDEYRYYRSDGSIAHVYDRGFVIYDNGEPVRMVGAMQDITKRKTAAEQLSKSEANLRNILDNTETGYVLLDENGIILSFNKVAVEILDCYGSRPLAEGERYLNCVPARRTEEVRVALEEVLTMERPVNYEVLLHAGSQEARWLYVSKHPIFSAEGRVLGLSIAVTDITRRKLADQRLIKSEANLRTIFDNTALSYVFLDRQLRVVSFNSAAMHSFHSVYRKELVEGENFISLLPEKIRLTTQCSYDLVLNGKKVSYERAFSVENGSRWYQVSAFPVYDELQNILGLILSGEDITSRKQAELEKERITSDLMQRNSALEQFAYIISHNLRSPVANITGLSNLVLHTPSLKKKDFERCMEGLALSVKKLDEVIIDLNRILQVRREINEKKEPVRFSSIIKDIKASLHHMLERENITIKTNFIAANELFTIKSYINSIFYNLISNSIKYRNPDVSPVIEISSRIKNDRVELTFRDNGLGIDLEANGTKLFGMYKKFHHHTEGKGMGLYMVKTQVEILGGTIEVRSEINKGTEFLISLKACGVPETAS